MVSRKLSKTREIDTIFFPTFIRAQIVEQPASVLSLALERKMQG